MHPDSYRLDKQGLCRAFNRAASRYDEAAILQHEVGGRLLERLELIRLQPQLVVDLGAGTGTHSRALQQRYRKAQIVSIDIAEQMLHHARHKRGWFSRQGFVCSDMEQMPLRDNCADLVFANLSFQWIQDYDGLFTQIQRILKPGGLLLFSTFGPDTLRELRQAWAAIEDGHVHVNAFIDMHDIGDAMHRCAFADPVMDMEHIVLTYENALALMKDLKAIGAHNINLGRNHGLTGRRHLDLVARAYEEFRQDGRLPATYEVVYGHGWAGEPGQGSKNRDGSISIPADSIGRQPRR